MKYNIDFYEQMLIYLELPLSAIKGTVKRLQLGQR